MRPSYDLVVLGGGAAGLVAAIVGASLGAKTALVERHRLGGECTWRGCVPSKALLHVAAIAHGVRLAKAFGMVDIDPQIGWSSVRAYLDRTRETIYAHADSPEALARFGVRTIAGDAVFLEACHLRVRGCEGESTLTARAFVICTGSDPVPLALDVPYETTDTIFDLDEYPHRLAIIGGGPASFELAQAFARLGTHVHVVSAATLPLENDDAEHARALRAVLEGEGVRFSLGARVVASSCVETTTVLKLSDASEVVCDRVLVAIGRMPRVTGYGLDAAGVNVRDGAIAVDTRGRTNVAHISAAGDAIGPPYFSHLSEETAKVAVANALLGVRKRFDRATVPWCTFTSPELAHVGSTAAALRARGTRFTTYTFANDALDRAIVDDATPGSTKLFVGRGGRVLGASILGVRAGELAGEVALAIRTKRTVAQIADTMHPYPSYSYGVRRAADAWYERLATPFVRRIVRTIFRFRGEAL